MTGGKNRYESWKKALRKRKIDKQVHWCGRDGEHTWYNNLHEYSKGKIHCSCGLCAAKTRKHGPTITDIRKIQRLEYAG